MMKRQVYLIAAMLGLALMLAVGCGAPESNSAASQQDVSRQGVSKQGVSKQGASDGQIQDAKSANRSRIANDAAAPSSETAAEASRPAEDRVIDSGLESLKLRMAVRAEKNPRKRAELQRKLEQVKLSRQSIYSRE